MQGEVHCGPLKGRFITVLVTMVIDPVVAVSLCRTPDSKHTAAHVAAACYYCTLLLHFTAAHGTAVRLVSEWLTVRGSL